MKAGTIHVAHSIPGNIQKLYNAVKHGGCQHYIHNNHTLSDGEGNRGFGFCTDYEDQGFIYLAGPGELGDMDVDCDGKESCSHDGDHQSGTAFDSILSRGRYGISKLDPLIHSYSVLGTCHVPVDKPSGGPVPPLSTVAVVCNNQLFYSVFGDTNGCDDADFTGEASYALANLCFPGHGLNGDKGYTGHNILYIAFMADDAVPGPDGADWQAKDRNTFETSLAKFGGKLVSSIKVKS
ncbi:glycoside hydrolase family 75 protein [Piloderma croceum F 1598]|uniref:Endo-chitosanase n=1 Tax=Piloderma croceum (strain F 1598) TaxID=765440 RepID=A0A0C3FAQ1_PILCF|nr:glycoside hydrolase family 75 protein [Piloderma croceum F 1598]